MAPVRPGSVNAPQIFAKSDWTSIHFCKGISMYFPTNSKIKSFHRLTGPSTRTVSIGKTVYGEMIVSKLQEFSCPKISDIFIRISLQQTSALRFRKVADVWRIHLALAIKILCQLFVVLIQESMFTMMRRMIAIIWISNLGQPFWAKMPKPPDNLISRSAKSAASQNC